VDLNPASKAPTAPIPLSVVDEAAIWPALLRMKPLQSFWELEMRTNHYQTMKDVLPDAWVLDPTPIPPGAVIPRLEISDWGDIEPLRSCSSSFILSDAWKLGAETSLSGSVSNEVWRSLLGSALQSVPSQIHVLTEVAPGSGAEQIIALYERTDKRTDLLGALSVSESSIAKVVSA
jgi:hypothetical protein